MEQEDLQPQDLVPLLGSRSRVSEVLNGKRPLTLAMIRRLHQGLGIPADVLLGETGNIRRRTA
jgi:HTH-type transcriptional regulator/antitoxin HigA